jgi:GNAT superfamily N-acetyltransferase
VIVRPIAAPDRERWLVLWAGYNAFYERPSLSPEITDVLWKRLFDPSEPVHGLVAELDGRVVGLTHYLFHRSTTMIAPTCYLQDLFTDASVRGRGVGRALIEGVYAAAREAGSPRVYWQTHETNATAMKLYDQIAERSGFVVYRKKLNDK